MLITVRLAICRSSSGASALAAQASAAANPFPPSRSAWLIATAGMPASAASIAAEIVPE